MSLEKAVSAYKPVLSAATFDQELVLDEVDSHPSWIMGFTKQLQANAVYVLEQYEVARTASNESTEYFNALRPIMPEQNPDKLLKREISNLNQIGRSYYDEEDFVKAAEIYLKAVSLREELVSLGADNAEYQLALSLTHAASAEHQNDNTEIELGYYRRAYNIFEKLREDDPESEDLARMIEWIQKAIDSHSGILAGDGSEADAYKQAYTDAKQNLINAPADKELQKELFENFRAVNGVYGQNWEMLAADFKLTIDDAKQFAEQLEANNGPSFFTYEMQYLAAYYLGAYEKEQDNIPAARANYENMLHFADLLAAAPDVSDFDVQERGYRVETYKLSAFYNLADLNDAGALNAARAGLRLAEAWDASGQLLTSEQRLLQQFKERIAELEAED